MKKIIPFLLFITLGSFAQKNSQPNIIIILSDDQGWGDLSFNGNTNLSTPNIDNLAKTGVSFDRFYANPVCSPTRAELLTGRYHPRGGVYSTSQGGERLDLDETTLADILKKAGYSTAAFGKWHSGMQPPYHPNARGFDDFYGFCSGHWGNYFSPMLEHNGKIVKGNGFLADDLTDKGLAFLEKNKNKPFLLYMPYNTPHSPMQVPDKWWKKFENKELEKLYHGKEKEDVEFTKAALAMCENLDWNVGRITKKVKDLGLSENTIIIYLSDNGPNGYRWNGGMKGRKGSTDEGGVRVPMFINWPKEIPAGKNVPQIASSIDILPTILDLAGIKHKVPKPLDGQSLKPIIMENQPKWNDRLVYTHWAGKISVRSQKFRLDAAGNLYNMIADPGQTTAVNQNYKLEEAKLQKAKQEWESEVLSELPKVDTRTFPVGHPDYSFTQIPARDMKASGAIKRSSIHPNDSFFYNWTRTSDSIYFEAEVLTEGRYEVDIYYTTTSEDVGGTFELSFMGEKINGKITVVHDPPLLGKENDRVARTESYVKEFKPLTLGQIYLKKGKGTFVLKPTHIPGKQLMDFRLTMLRRL